MHRLRHPHVLQLLGVCEAPLAIVTELCGAGSLESLLRKGHPRMASWKQRLLVATYVAQALEYLHLSCVLHNDVKAANVLLTSDFTVKLADYGAAVQLGGASDKSDAAANHNPRWLAPELIKEASGSFPADVYAFGVLLYELMACSVPFGSTTKDAEVGLGSRCSYVYTMPLCTPCLCAHHASVHTLHPYHPGGAPCGAGGMATSAARPAPWGPIPPSRGPQGADAPLLGTKPGGSADGGGGGAGAAGYRREPCTRRSIVVSIVVI